MSELSEQKELARAKNIVSRLFKVRRRSEYEIRSRLKLKEISDSVAEKIISELKKQTLIDDRKFTYSWIAARLTKPFGLRRITFELKQKGINDELIKEGVAFAKQNYDEKPQMRLLAKKYLSKHKRLDPQEQLKHVSDYLARQGFSEENIESVLPQL